MVSYFRRNKSVQKQRNIRLLSRQLTYDSLFQAFEVNTAYLPDCWKGFLVNITNKQYKNPALALRISKLVYLSVTSTATDKSSDKLIMMLLN